MQQTEKQKKRTAKFTPSGKPVVAMNPDRAPLIAQKCTAWGVNDGRVYLLCGLLLATTLQRSPNALFFAQDVEAHCSPGTTEPHREAWRTSLAWAAAVVGGSGAGALLHASRRWWLWRRG